MVELIEIILAGILIIWLAWHFSIEDPVQEEHDIRMESY